MLHSAIMIVISTAAAATATTICLIVCAVAIKIIIQVNLIKLLNEITMQNQIVKLATCNMASNAVRLSLYHGNVH